MHDDIVTAKRWWCSFALLSHILRPLQNCWHGVILAYHTQHALVRFLINQNRVG